MLNEAVNDQRKEIDTWLPKCKIENKEDPRILTPEGE
jgi:hypothetical protein